MRRFFPRSTLAIGGVSITPGRFRHAEAVANLATVAKHEAKQDATGMVLHGGLDESGKGVLAATRALRDVLAAQAGAVTFHGRQCDDAGPRGAGKTAA